MPLCAAVALKSYPPGVAVPPGTVVNKFLADQAESHRVKLSVLSPVAANLSGAKRHVDHLVRDYPFMLCAFYDPGQATEYKNIYTACMQSVPLWIDIVQGQMPERPENLLLDRTNYGPVCVP
jgi:hypothetical protein